MNARDSEKIHGILENIGYVEASENDTPDLILFNTCTVRENANLKVYGNLGNLKKEKAKNPDMIIGLCGCMMQEPDVVEKIKKSYSFVNLIFGTHNLYKFGELLNEVYSSNKMVVDVLKDTKLIVEKLPTERKYSFKSGVNIMFGCDNFCTYCIVPYVRGRERSRKPEHIIREIKDLVNDGVVEIMLLGQNVNSYGKGLENPISFAKLLQMVEEIEGLKRIRFMTSHPKDLSDELIDVMSKSKKICRHIHLPVQSGSNSLLKRMNRHYTKESYLELVDKIRKAMPDISITTDIIVGFPGETEEDFEDTMDVVKKVRYDSAYTFIYSKRTGTPAAKFPDQVPEDVVKDRFNRLLKQVQEDSAYRNAQKLGNTVDVLVEEQNTQNTELVTGKMDNNSTVHFKGNKELIGQIVKVHLDEAKGFYYYGTIVTDDAEIHGDEVRI
jgi:tRNA-2-methylthio-N6-dimethylallyladenosine synthase